jgi:ribosomal-protein-alanine N-acetyltransferase
MAAGYEIPSLAGSRVALRPIEPQEMGLIQQWYLECDPLAQTCRVPGLGSIDRAIRSAGERAPSAGEGDLAIVLRATGTIVGRIRFFDVNPRNRSCEIGYIAAPGARGKGYAREGVAVLLDYLFDGLGLNKVQAQTGAFNATSIRLLESLGFSRDAVLREHHLYKAVLHDDFIYSVLALEWRARRSV